MPQRLADATLILLYSVLHKTDIWNWTPSSNSTNVTRQRVLVLCAIGMGKPFNFGQHVFNIVLDFADGGLKYTKLPFPSLIYGTLESQGFISHIRESLTGAVDVLKLASALLKGNMMIDLPWSSTGVVADVENTADNTPIIPVSALSVPAPAEASTIAVSAEFLHSQLAFALN